MGVREEPVPGRPGSSVRARCTLSCHLEGIPSEEKERPGGFIHSGALAPMLSAVCAKAGATPAIPAETSPARNIARRSRRPLPDTLPLSNLDASTRSFFSMATSVNIDLRAKITINCGAQHWPTRSPLAIQDGADRELTGIDHTAASGPSARYLNPAAPGAVVGHCRKSRLE